MSDSVRRAVICFTRVPVPGQVKTRLLPLLGAEGCALLQTAFLRDLADVYSGVGADLFIAFTGASQPGILRGIFPNAADFFPQEGADLGARMDGAIRRVLSLGYDVCVLTGSDLPLMTAAHIESGFMALEGASGGSRNGADITLGPTPDGGYYLVGMKEPCAELFAGKTYGGANVYEDAVSAIAAAGRSFRPAMMCSDADTPEDIHRLWELMCGSPGNPLSGSPGNPPHGGSDTHTARFLRDVFYNAEV